jgi:hypothetical protein
VAGAMGLESGVGQVADIQAGTLPPEDFLFGCGGLCKESRLCTTVVLVMLHPPITLMWASDPSGFLSAVPEGINGILEKMLLSRDVSEENAVHESPCLQAVTHCSAAGHCLAESILCVG